MSLPIYLSNIKSAGVYRYVFDKSQVPEAERDSIRLVVGYSEKGPFNTPVYVESAQEFINYFGGISRRMERKGVFFHRLAIQALEAGPILALNVKPFNLHGKTEKANIIAFNANELMAAAYAGGDARQQFHIPEEALVAATSKGMRDVTLSTIYDTNRFWHVDSSRLHDIKMGANSDINGASDLIRIARVSDNRDDCTIFMRPVVPTNWHVKVSDWYSSNQSYPMPPYMEYLKDHYLDEFFMEIYVFRGNMVKSSLFDYTGTLGANLPVQFVYATYPNGDIVYYADGKTEGAALKNADKSLQPVIQTVRAYEDGVYKSYPVNTVEYDDAYTTYLDAMAEATTTEEEDAAKSALYTATTVTLQTGEGSWYDKMGLDTTDTYSPAPEYPTTSDENQLSWVPFCIVDKNDSELYLNPNYVNAYGELADPLEDMAEVSTSNYVASYVGTTIPGFRDGLGSFISIDTLFNADSDIHGMLMNIDESKLDAAMDLDSDASGYYSSNDEYDSGDLTDSQRFVALSATGGAHTHSGLIWVGISDYHNWTPAQYLTTILSGVKTLTADLSAADKTTLEAIQKAQEAVKAAQSELDAANKALDTVNADQNATTEAKTNAQTAVTNAETKVKTAKSELDAAQASGSTAIQNAETKVKTAKSELDAALAKVKQEENKLKTSKGSEAAVTAAQETAKTARAAYQTAIATLEKAKLDANTGIEISDYDDVPVTRWVRGTLMKGYQYTSIARNASGADMQADVFAALSYKGLREALSNNVDIDYHYMIDTFQTYPGIGMKSIMTQIVKDKDNAILITNFPTMESVMRHCGHTAYTGGFEMSEILKSKNGISLPTETQGASWAAYYTQLKMSDGASKFTVPASALVSNLFMTKLAKRQAYDIVAGVNHGLIKYEGVLGPDYNYARKDADVLEPFGVNIITYVPRYGTSIQGNQTAKQTPQTALSKLHIRELIIFLQDEIEKMLRGYQWELNTSELRQNILSKADVILGLAQANGGIYKYRAKCDSDNNTDEIIDKEMVVLDVEIEPTRGAEKMVQTLTIHRTGGIASSPAN